MIIINSGAYAVLPNGGFDLMVPYPQDSRFIKWGVQWKQGVVVYIMLKAVLR